MAEEKNELIGMDVFDSEGVELGYVSDVVQDYIEVSEGAFDQLLLNKRYIGSVGEKKIVLKNTLVDLLEGMAVVDKNAVEIGKVTDVLETGDVLDAMIIEMPDAEDGFAYMTLEDIYSINGNIKLDITKEDVLFEQKSHTLRESIAHLLRRKKK